MDGVDALHIYPECRMTTMGKEYRGTHSQTQTGRKCWHWKMLADDSELISSVYFLFEILQQQVMKLSPLSVMDRQIDIYELISKQDLNYCRNPTSAEQPWCFISTNYSQWEFCDIPFCSGRKELPECRLTEEGREYAGFMNVDSFGRKCQPWLTPDPKRFELLNFLAFPDQLMNYSYNYCRNPDLKEDRLWCFIEEGTWTGQGECEVPFCYEAYERSALKGKPAQGYPECLQTTMGKEYVGTTKKTLSGKSCLRWDAQPYGKLEDFDPKLSYDDHFRFGSAASHQDFCRNPTSMLEDFDPKLPYDDHFRFGSAASHQDFCRNPTLKTQPWCFVADPFVKWEFCDIPLCPNYPSKLTTIHG
ncbi:unnamed protein product [Darwinula stevensoni]|uniref:Kringle domain-containing protein n=1 Tax=Darwinula stevensoni TaxID=69355 RepID=A0A7R9A3R7_9CRUS|nr:unnamed protein product [Darwinula stevensoni]CAG0888525.1 unnamed protein product [Darwinula stevensoni]